MKALLPTLKEKKRYVQFLKHGPGSINVMNALEQTMGVLGLAKAGVRLLAWNGKEGILRVKAGFENEVIAALTLITGNFVLETTKTSALINRVKEVE